MPTLQEYIDLWRLQIWQCICASASQWNVQRPQRALQVFNKYLSAAVFETMMRFPYARVLACSTAEARREAPSLRAAYLREMCCLEMKLYPEMYTPCELCCRPTDSWCEGCDNCNHPVCRECEDAGLFCTDCETPSFPTTPNGDRLHAQLLPATEMQG